MVKRHDSKNPGLIQDILVPLKVEKKIGRLQPRELAGS